MALAEAERAGPHANLSPAMAAAHSTHAFKKAASAAVKEFCDSEDYDEVARILSVRTPKPPLFSSVHSPEIQKNNPSAV